MGGWDAQQLKPFMKIYPSVYDSTNIISVTPQDNINSTICGLVSCWALQIVGCGSLCINVSIISSIVPRVPSQGLSASLMMPSTHSALMGPKVLDECRAKWGVDGQRKGAVNSLSKRTSLVISPLNNWSLVNQSTNCRVWDTA